MSDTTPEPSESTEDFDAFWQSRTRRKRTTTIMGETVTLPPALPLQFEMEARRLQRSKRDADVRKLVAIIFGDDAMAKWTDAGMDLEQFQVLLAWAPQVIAGVDVTLAQVADELSKAEDEPDPT